MMSVLEYAQDMNKSVEEIIEIYNFNEKQQEQVA